MILEHGAHLGAEDEGNPVDPLSLVLKVSKRRLLPKFAEGDSATGEGAEHFLEARRFGPIRCVIVIGQILFDNLAVICMVADVARVLPASHGSAPFLDVFLADRRNHVAQNLLDELGRYRFDLGIWPQMARLQEKAHQSQGWEGVDVSL